MTDASPPFLPGYRFERLRVRHLRLLDIIHRTGSLGGAARELNLSQPAVTLLLQELEENFGVPLVSRGARGGRLTPAGLRALERLRVALASLNMALEAVAPPVDEPIVRLGCVQLASVDALPRALARITPAEACRLQIEEGTAAELLQSLVAGELDCVIGWMDEAVVGTIDLDRIVVEPLWRSHMKVVAAAGHPLARRARVAVADLAGERWVMHKRGSRTHATFQRLFLQQGMAPPPVSVACPSIHTAIQIVAHTDMIGLAPDRLLATYAQSGRVVALRGGELDLGRVQLSLFTPVQNTGLPGVLRLREALGKKA
ncbi:MAG: LysR family transcriptional regulator [Alcaligenaceae bacterium]|nr:LysR family transcriptional regulator [Alcaligenaceae bacterium SAGV5]MPS50331.1 LysR family transcriptional regulator [Alcaligenaceae bacterium SAGV3]MPT58682.1 LysR family transcriptional regulator [Alcaligenaceae bacterium]